MCSHYSSGLITRHKANWVSFRRRSWLRNCLWPPVPDVVKRHLRWGAINYPVSQMNSRLQRSNMRRSHAWKPPLTLAYVDTHGRGRANKQRNKQVMAGAGETQEAAALRCHAKVSQALPYVCYQRIHLQQIASGCNAFFSNSHQRFSSLPEGLSPDSPANRAAQCNSGLYKPECYSMPVIGTLTVLRACICACAAHSSTGCPLVHVWDLVRTRGKRKTKESHDQLW